jgi:F-type H+-transporting ATPase subunit O
MLSRFSKLFTTLPKLNKSPFTPFAYNFASGTEDIKSVIGHKPPSLEDTPHGRYASVLFTTASKQEGLATVLEDVKNLKEIYNQSDIFKNFVFNTAFKRTEQLAILEEIQGMAGLNPLTVDFLSTLIDNKRLDILPKVLDKYVEFYRILNKEENITIISAEELSSEQRERVRESLQQANKGVTFTLKFEIDPTILGGLQMYSGNKFMDCSLSSRISRVKGELAKISF